MKLIHILLVEDDPLDVINIKRNLDKLGIRYVMNLASDGLEAIDYLNKKKDSGNLPDIILLDNNMPKLNGLDFLKIIRNSDDFKRLKCFMITGSDQAVDKQMAKFLGISGYLVKPLRLHDTRSMDSLSLIIDLMNF